MSSFREISSKTKFSRYSLQQALFEKYTKSVTAVGFNQHYLQVDVPTRSGQHLRVSVPIFLQKV